MLSVFKTLGQNVVFLLGHSAPEMCPKYVVLHVSLNNGRTFTDEE